MVLDVFPKIFKVHMGFRVGVQYRGWFTITGVQYKGGGTVLERQVWGFDRGF